MTRDEISELLLKRMQEAIIGHVPNEVEVFSQQMVIECDDPLPEGVACVQGGELPGPARIIRAVPDEAGRHRYLVGILCEDPLI